MSEPVIHRPHSSIDLRPERKPMATLTLKGKLLRAWRMLTGPRGLL